MFPETLKHRAPIGLNEAIKVAARKRHQTGGEYVRQVLLRALLEEGVTLRDGRVQEIEPARGVAR